MIELKKGNNIYYSRTSNSNFPFIFGIVSEGSGVCKYYKMQNNVTIKRDKYVLNKEMKTLCENGNLDNSF